MALAQEQKPWKVGTQEEEEATTSMGWQEMGPTPGNGHPTAVHSSL